MPFKRVSALVCVPFPAVGAAAQSGAGTQAPGGMAVPVGVVVARIS